MGKTFFKRMTNVHYLFIFFFSFFQTLSFSRFKDVVECERIILKAFMTGHEVSSFRANKLSEDFYHAKAEYERKKTMAQTKDDFTRDPTRDLLAGQQRASEGQGKLKIVKIVKI